MPIPNRTLVYYVNVVKQRLHSKTNENDELLGDFLISKSMTGFRGHQKMTRVSPDGYTKNEIDNFFIDTRHKSNLIFTLEASVN